MKENISRAAGFLLVFGALALPRMASARIEIILMGQTNGLRPPPFNDELWFRGTPFGHMALYVESAAGDREKIIRQCGDGERGGLVLTVDKQLKDSFFIATPRDEFFYGKLNPEEIPASVSRGDIGQDLAEFNEKYGSLYEKGPGISGFGQDYGILYIRNARGLVYPTTREEEAKIIEYWQQHRHDEFHPTHNNCATTINRSLIDAGLTERRRFFRGHSCYNSWVHWLRKLVTAPAGARAPDGDFIRRDHTYVTQYDQIPSEAVLRTGRPFNAWSLLNMEYLIWLSSRGELPVTGELPVHFAQYPTGREKPTAQLKYGYLKRRLVRGASEVYEFLRLWPQTFYVIWWGITH